MIRAINSAGRSAAIAGLCKCLVNVRENETCREPREKLRPHVDEDVSKVSLFCLAIVVTRFCSWMQHGGFELGTIEKGANTMGERW